MVVKIHIPAPMEKFLGALLGGLFLMVCGGVAVIGGFALFYHAALLLQLGGAEIFLGIVGGILGVMVVLTMIRATL